MVEHPLEFELGDRGLDRSGIGRDRAQRVVVVLGLRHLEQLGSVLEAAVDVAQVENDAFEEFLLAPEFLRVLGVVPDL